jgi:hypothetical protein
MKKAAFAVLIAALVAAFAFWWFSPTQVLKRRTRDLLKALTIESATGQAGRQLGVYSLTPLLASEVELESESNQEANGRFDRAELESVYASLCQHAKQTHFKIEKFDRVAVSGGQAEVELTLQALVELQNIRPVDGRHEARLHWMKDKDGWRLVRAFWRESKP